jgi:hypothetical protein
MKLEKRCFSEKERKNNYGLTIYENEARIKILGGKSA